MTSLLLAIESSRQTLVQKKSKKGIATPKAEIDKIKRRLKEAESLVERENEK